MEKDLNMLTTFQKMKIFKESYLAEIIITSSKLIEKYSNLAREALSSGDKILSENYFQHADHFTRILNDQDYQKRNNLMSDNSTNLKQDLDNKEEVKNNIQEK